MPPPGPQPADDGSFSYSGDASASGEGFESSGEGSAEGAEAEPASDWRAKSMHVQNSIGASTGLLRVREAGSGAPGTFRFSLCLNNEDSRLSCSPGGTTALKLSGKLAGSAGAQSLVSALGTFGATPTGNGRSVSFPSAFTERNQCTPFSDFVLARTKKTAKSKLGAVITAAGAGKDKDKLKLI